MRGSESEAEDSGKVKQKREQKKRKNIHSESDAEDTGKVKEKRENKKKNI